jgi:hypothetical protein
MSSSGDFEMSWFERHLNWSLFFAVILLPLTISLIFFVIYSIAIGGIIAASITMEEPTPDFIRSLFSTMLPFAVISIVIALGILIFDIVATVWYLGRKDRSQGYLILIAGPLALGFMSRFFYSGILGLLAGLGFIAGIIIIFLLENHAIGYGGDIGYEPAAVGSSDSGGYSEYGREGGYDDRQTAGPDYTKELDYTPTQNVLDISGGPPARDVSSMGDVPDIGGAGVEEGAREEAPLEKVIDRPVSYESPSMPILLGDDGNVIRCAYHPNADAVNLCSRCGQYVCIECNYITGTHPICRNCWGKRTEAPLAPPQQKQVKPAPVKPEQQKVVESPQPVKQEEPAPVEPEVLPITEVAEPVEQIAAEPAQQIVVEPVRSPEQETTARAIPEEPPAAAVVKPEEQQTAVPIKPTQPDAAKSQWQTEFMAIYQQASPIVNVIIKKGADGMPGSPLDLMEGLKLRPMLVLVKKLSKPKDRDLREVKSELEQVLSSCIKIAESAADFVGGGGQALIGGPDFKRIVDGIEKASGLMEKLSQWLPAFSRPREE